MDLLVNPPTTVPEMTMLGTCHGSTGSPLALSGILRGGMTVLEGAGILARGTGFCT